MMAGFFSEEGLWGSGFNWVDALAVTAGVLTGGTGYLVVKGAETAVDLGRDVLDGDGEVDWSEHLGNAAGAAAGLLPGGTLAGEVAGRLAGAAGDQWFQGVEDHVNARWNYGRLTYSGTARTGQGHASDRASSVAADGRTVGLTTLARWARDGDEAALEQLLVQISQAAGQLGLTVPQFLAPVTNADILGHFLC